MVVQECVLTLEAAKQHRPKELCCAVTELSSRGRTEVKYFGVHLETNTVPWKEATIHYLCASKRTLNQA